MISFTNRKRRVIASINKKNRSVSRSVCLSGFTFRHALTSHADIRTPRNENLYFGRHVEELANIFFSFAGLSLPWVRGNFHAFPS